MLEKIHQLERAAQILEPNETTRTQWMLLLTNHLNDFYKKTLAPDGKVLNFEIPQNPSSWDFKKPQSLADIIQFLDQTIHYDALNAASPKHMAYVPGGGVFPSAMGDFIGAFTNKYVGIYHVGPNAAMLENDLISWMAEFIGYDTSTAAGSLASGGSIANLTAVVAARDAMLTPIDYEKAVVYTTVHTHHCIQKALKIAGFNYGNDHTIHYIETDDKYKMSVPHLQAAIQNDRANGRLPWLIVASAGTTNLGTIDPLEAIGEVAQREKIWYHIDAAYGGYFMLSEAKDNLKGIQLSDSIVMDAHKSFFLPYGIGAVIVKNKQHLLESFLYTAEYLREGAELELSPANLSPELTKNFRGLRLWLPLKLYGIAPFIACLNEKLYLTQYAYQEVANIPNLQVIGYPELTTFGFRYYLKDKDTEALNHLNEKLLALIIEEGEVYLSSATINGQFIIRITILSFRTHLAQVEHLLTIIKEKTTKLEDNELKIKGFT